MDDSRSISNSSGDFARNDSQTILGYTGIKNDIERKARPDDRTKPVRSSGEKKTLNKGLLGTGMSDRRKELGLSQPSNLGGLGGSKQDRMREVSLGGGNDSKFIQGNNDQFGANLNRDDRDRR